MKFSKRRNFGFVTILGCSSAIFACSPNSGSTGSTPLGFGGSGNNSATGGTPSFNAGAGGPSGTVGGGVNAVQPDGLHITGKIRDFHVTFPDMEPCTNSGSLGKTCDSGHVEQQSTPSDSSVNCGAGTAYPNNCFIGKTLGDDFKPQYVGPATGTLTTTGPDNFKWWFNTDPSGAINMEKDLEFILTPNNDGTGTFTYNNTAYFPIDGELFGDEGQKDGKGVSHNYGFTTEFHMKFTYRKGQTFYFKGDDDLTVFINNQLAVDRSGIHNAQDATLKLDDLGLQPGQSYQFDLFYCERHRTLSDLMITTSMEFTESVQIN